MPAPATDVTEALDALRAGNDAASGRLLQAVYDELRALAHAQRRHERPDHTLNTTALVHEAYFKLLGPSHGDYEGRAHFFGAAVRAMRQVLVDYARARHRAKRGHGEPGVSLDALPPDGSAEPALLTDARAAEVLDLDAALERLAALDPRQARLVECRYFGGLSVEETAEVLGVGPATVKREWRSARAWLYVALKDGPARASGPPSTPSPEATDSAGS